MNRSPSLDPSAVRLRQCDIAQCEGLCCYDGAYLEPGDEERIAAARSAYPEFFRDVPAEAIVVGQWRDQPPGRKTATRPWTYRRPIPAHFTATRCVFAGTTGLCALETAARAHQLHPWTFKPTICYLFPLDLGGDEPGPIPPGADPYDLGPEYPGYTTVVDCGAHHPNGRPWPEVLERELATLVDPVSDYFERWRKERTSAT
jgi:hypothetical protein